MVIRLQRVRLLVKFGDIISLPLYQNRQSIKSLFEQFGVWKTE